MMRRCQVLVIVVLCAGVFRIVHPENTPGTETPLERFHAAQTAPCSTAVAAYESLSADTTVPDTVRSLSFGLLADYAFALREYETARDNYKKAFALDPKKTRYAYRSGLSYLANSDTVDAITTFIAIADKNDPDFSNDARVALARIAYLRNDYKAALEYYRQTGDFIPTNSWSVSASFGKLLCTRALGLADSAAFYEKQLSRFSKTILEKEAFAKIKGAAVIQKIDSVAPPAPPLSIDSGKIKAVGEPIDSSVLFTLQVGAFASESAALVLKKKLAKKFKEVRCETAVISARTFYRVWVGNFKTREAAEKFGQNEIMELGLLFRVVAP